MSHYAKVENGVVTKVIVAETKEWCESNLGGTWVETLKNNFNEATYSPNSGVTINEKEITGYKNYAGIGYTFDGIGFAAPKPHSSWSLNQNTYQWEAPTPIPNDDKIYYWSEADLSWREKQ
jgi:hypothetical protein